MDNLDKNKQTNFYNDVTKEYYPSLDILKFILAYLVILRHCGQAFSTHNDFIYRWVTNCFSCVAVPIFFTISGFFFFKKNPDTNVLFKQLWRIFRLYIIWSIIYLPFVFRSFYFHRETFISFIQRFFFDGTHYHLWYLPSLIVALTVVFLLRKSNKFIFFMLAFCLFCIGLLGDTYSFVRGQDFDVIMQEYRKIFLTTRNGFFVGTLFVFLGLIISNITFKIKSWIFIMFLLLSLLLLGVEGKIFGKHYPGVNNLFLFTVPVSFICVLFAVRAGNCFRFNTRNIRSIGTLLYFGHPFIITIISKIASLLNLSIFMGYILVLVFSSFLAVVICLLSKKVKWINYLY